MEETRGLNEVDRYSSNYSENGFWEKIKRYSPDKNEQKTAFENLKKLLNQ